MMTKEFRLLNNILAWLVCAIATYTYCSTIEPTASFWDCGEYIACAYKLEVGHPPGAPFFLLLGRFFALFAGSDPSQAAMMVNVMSALASAFTILFLFWTITRLGIKIYARRVADISKGHQWAILGAAVVGSLAYTFSDSFWFSAVEGEVYALSSFFTAIVFWASLKWDDEDTSNPTGALRWIVFISYLVGISIGVHLLNLLVIPAIGYIIYFKKYKFSWKGFFLAGISSVLVLGFVQNLVIPKIVKFISDYEVFFVNKLHLGFNYGLIIFFLLLITALVYLIAYTVNKNQKYYTYGFYSAIAFSAIAVLAAQSLGGAILRLILMGGVLYAIHVYKKKTITLNAVFLSFATLLIGYSSFFVLVIRSSANTPMDENDPENAPNMLSYLLREQYGDWPILHGQYYNARPAPRNEYGSGDPIYAKDETNKKYKVVDERKNSIVKYDPKYTTIFPRMWSNQSHHVSGYKYWGNVDENHRTVQVEDENGINTIEVPTMKANLTYFFKYQVGYMYWRYFLWNFVGRQNDIQGSTGNNLEGNWITGIKAFDNKRLDFDTTNTIHRDKRNFAFNKFYALPMLLGLLGLIFHFQRNSYGAWVVLCFFFLTGLAIVIYLNQQPFQPRERDYAYTGSFYAFCIWIGYGVLFIYDQVSKRAPSMGMAIGSTALCLVVPGIMAKEGWDDHNRSLRTLSRDCAINYLQSCAPNAIIFTNGDNDTFPLWYAQEVEGIRTDVRVVNLSLLQTDWYIKQMRRAAYTSKPVPFTIPEEKLEAEKLSIVYISGQEKNAVGLRKAVDYAISSDINDKIDAGGSDYLDILPSRKLYMDVDIAQVLKNKVVGEKDTARLVKRIEWDLGNRGYILKNDIMVLDLLANNNWERPIYFAVTTGDEAYLGLKKYFQLEGLAYRFVPIEQTRDEEAQGGRVNTEAMYDNIMNKFQWGGQDKAGINMDENCVRMTGNLRMQMGILAGALIGEGQNKKAKEVLDKCLEKMPDENIPFDATVFALCVGYYEIGETEKANALSKKLFGIYEGDLRVYGTMPGNRLAAYSRDIAQAKDILKRLTGMAQQYRQDSLYKEYVSRISTVITAEDTNQQDARKYVPQLQ